MSILTALIGPVTGLLDKFIADADTKAKIAFDLATMAEVHANEQIKAQLEVNKTEAAHPSIFVSGWRPAVGWVCVCGMGINFIVVPLLGTALDITALDLSEMMPVLLGMLGLGGMRSYEKKNGIARTK